MTKKTKKTTVKDIKKDKIKVFIKKPKKKVKRIVYYIKNFNAYIQEYNKKIKELKLRRNYRDSSKYKKKLYLKVKKKRIHKPLIERSITAKFIGDTDIHYGIVKPIDVNIKLSGNIFALRNNFVIYNISRLTNTLRKSMQILYTFIGENKVLFINTVTKDKAYTEAVSDGLKNINKHFLCTYHKWVGGSITNFKNIYKRAKFKNILNKVTEGELSVITKKKTYIEGLYILKKRPQPASLYNSLGELHVGMNEAQRINMYTMQNIEANSKILSADLSVIISSTIPTKLILLALLNQILNKYTTIEKGYAKTKFQHNLFFHIRKRKNSHFRYNAIKNNKT